jgi:hypothetical protein
MVDLSTRRREDPSCGTPVCAAGRRLFVAYKQGGETLHLKVHVAWFEYDPGGPGTAGGGWIVSRLDSVAARGTYDLKLRKLTVSDRDMREDGMAGYLALVRMAERARELGILP